MPRQLPQPLELDLNSDFEEKPELVYETPGTPSTRDNYVEGLNKKTIDLIEAGDHMSHILKWYMGNRRRVTVDTVAKALTEWEIAAIEFEVD